VFALTTSCLFERRGQTHTHLAVVQV